MSGLIRQIRRFGGVAALHRPSLRVYTQNKDTS
jgi:hypothetical protein